MKKSKKSKKHNPCAQIDKMFEELGIEKAFIFYEKDDHLHSTQYGFGISELITMFEHEKYKILKELTELVGHNA